MVRQNRGCFGEGQGEARIAFLRASQHNASLFPTQKNEMNPLPYAHGAVTACAFSGQGDIVVLGTSEGFIEVFSLPTGDRLHGVKLFRHEVQAVALSQDKRKVIAGSSNGELALWNINTQEKIALARGSGSAHARAAFSESGELAAVSFTTMFHGHEGTTVYLIQGQEVLHLASYRKANCQALWFVQEQLCALIDGKLEKLSENLKRTPLLASKQAVLAFSSMDGSLVAGKDEISFFASSTAKPQRLPNGLSRQEYFISPTHKLIIALESRFESNRVRCFSYQGALLRDQELDGFRFFFCEATAQLLSCSLDEEATLYHLKEGSCGITLREKNTILHRAFVFRRDESVALLSYEDNLGLVLHTKNKGSRPVSDSSGCHLDQLMVSADASRAVGLDWSGLARVWDLNTLRLTTNIPFFQKNETRGMGLPTALLSFDGDFLASTIGAFRLFSVKEQKDLTPPGFEPIPKAQTEAEDASNEEDKNWLPEAYQAQLLPGGKGVALYHKEVGSLLFAFGNGERRSLSGRGVSGCAGFDLDWQWAALASSRQVKLLSLENADEFSIPRPHKTKVLQLFFSPTAERLALITGKSNNKGSSSKTRLQLPSYDDTAINYLKNTQGDFIALHEMSIEIYSVVNKSFETSLSLSENFSFVGLSDNGKNIYIEIEGELQRYQQQKSKEYVLVERAIALPGGKCLWANDSKIIPTPPPKTTEPWKNAPIEASLLEVFAKRAEEQKRKPQLSTSAEPRMKLSKVSLPRASFEQANLAWAELSQSDLRGSNLKRATLSGADLSKASLQGADLVGAKLSGARLEQANLFEASLRWADISIKSLNTAKGVLRFLHKEAPSSLWQLAFDQTGERIAVVYSFGEKLYLSQFDLAKRERIFWTQIPEHTELLSSDDGDYLWLIGAKRLLVFARGVQLCDEEHSLEHQSSFQNKSRRCVLSSDGASLWYASKKGLLCFSSKARSWLSVLVPGSMTLSSGKLARHQDSLALLQMNDDLSFALWVWSEDSTPTSHQIIRGLQHAVEFFLWDSEFILVDRELQMWRLDLETKKLTRLGACQDINNHSWLSLQKQSFFAAETTPSLWDLSGELQLQALGASEQSSFCAVAIISSNESQIAAIQSTSQSILLWDVPNKERPSFLWPSLRLWVLPEGEFLFYQQDGFFIASNKADEHLWVRWPNGELSSLEDSKVKRWKASP
jgi:WD40 repeat protein